MVIILLQTSILTPFFEIKLNFLKKHPKLQKREFEMDKVYNLLTVFCVLLASTNAAAAGSDDAPTLMAEANYGLTTHKSALLSSNDTTTTLRYGAQVLAGDSKHLAFAYFAESTTTAFELNSASMASNWTQTYIRYRGDYFYAGVVIASLTCVAMSDASTTVFSMVGSGYGGNLGLTLPFGRGSVFYTDITSASISEITEASKLSLTFGSKTDVELGARMMLMKRKLYFNFGYRTSTIPITLTTSTAETLTSTFFGFASSFDF
jgi:hypothetical protein